jgi:putative resolvase
MIRVRRKGTPSVGGAAVSTVVVEHRDRWGRMNTELVEATLSAHERRLVVLDHGEVTVIWCAICRRY